MSKNKISRREFLKSATATAVATTAMSTLGSFTPTPAMAAGVPKKWDYTFDVVIVGYGGAGATTAITAHDKGAKVLILEKAPEAEAGGNTSVCGGESYSHQNIDSAIKYLTAMNGPFPLDKDLVELWANKMAENGKWMTNVLECKTTTWRPWEEFPEFPGVENSGCWIVGRKPDSGWGHNLWDLFKAAIAKRKIEVWYESPGKRLVQKPETRAILGVVAEKAGKKQVYIKARKGVVLTCGGFQNNPKMIQDYLHIPIGYPKGTPYATGDGVTMGLEVGADLWHMNNIAGPDFNFKAPDLRMSFGYSAGAFLRKNCICVGADGTRFWNEATSSRHGKILQSGTWIPTPMPLPVHAIFDSVTMKSGPIYPDTGTMSWWTVKKVYSWSKDNSKELAKGWIVQADTIAELARKINKDPGKLEATLKQYNEFCAAGMDPQFGRPKTALLPVSAGPFYAMELMATFTNTQGGPRRNKEARVLDTMGKPIPRLYSGGELGSMYSHCYNGGGNIGECMAFGRIAGENAAAEKPWA
jgi:succinate dehydrogenase/fumarate reductase flavoprotein subunit